jgi:hypothetical protein
VLRELVAAHPDCLTPEDLCRSIYGRAAERLAPGSKALAMAVSRLRAVLEPYGFTIPKNKTAPGPLYRLVPLEGDPCR